MIYGNIISEQGVFVTDFDIFSQNISMQLECTQMIIQESVNFKSIVERIRTFIVTTFNKFITWFRTKVLKKKQEVNKDNVIVDKYANDYYDSNPDTKLSDSQKETIIKNKILQMGDDGKITYAVVFPLFNTGNIEFLIGDIENEKSDYFEEKVYLAHIEKIKEDHIDHLVDYINGSLKNSGCSKQISSITDLSNIKLSDINDKYSYLDLKYISINDCINKINKYIDKLDSIYKEHESKFNSYCDETRDFYTKKLKDISDMYSSFERFVDSINNDIHDDERDYFTNKNECYRLFLALITEFVNTDIQYMTKYIQFASRINDESVNKLNIIKAKIIMLCNKYKYSYK